MWILVGCAVVVILFLIFRFSNTKGKNPFNKNHAQPRTPIVTDFQEKKKRLSRSFKASDVPENVDVVVIGSGMGGLVAANLLSKAGKRVVVLEQHDIAGGCTHVYQEKGYEFDVGVHYIGQMHYNSLPKFLFNQVTDGQLEWERLDEIYDEIILRHPGHPDGVKRVYLHEQRDAFVQNLKTSFPDNEKDIDRFMNCFDQARKGMLTLFQIKFMPLWMIKAIDSLGLGRMFFKDYIDWSTRSLQEVLDEITENEDLRAVLAYNFGDYGTIPSETPFLMHCYLLHHFLAGSSYPVGGSAEFAYHMIPGIEASGGCVFVRAPVTEIIYDASTSRVTGVKVGKHDHVIKAGTVLSAAGLANTISLLDEAVVEKYTDLEVPTKTVDQGLAALTVFIGLNESSEALELKKRNYWIFWGGNKFDVMKEQILNQDPSNFLGDSDELIPFMFVSFPSTKDPTWNQRFPNKSTCEIVTLAPFEWFEQWKDEKAKHHSSDYEELKKALGETMIKQIMTFFPQLEGKIDYMEVGSPLTNNYYINSRKGEIYGLDHNLARFQLSTCAQLRPTTSIPGLYLSGQDVTTCGVVGAAMGGLVGASAVLNRNLFQDMVKAKKKFSPSSKQQKKTN